MAEIVPYRGVPVSSTLSRLGTAWGFRMPPASRNDLGPIGGGARFAWYQAADVPQTFAPRSAITVHSLVLPSAHRTSTAST